MAVPKSGPRVQTHAANRGNLCFETPWVDFGERKIEIVNVYCDESGNGNGSKHLVIAATVIEGRLDEELRQRINNAYATALIEGHLLDTEERLSNFANVGFRRSYDSPDLQAEFRAVIRSTQTAKHFVLATDRTGLAGESEGDQMKYLYLRLLSTVCARYRDARRVNIVLERNDQLHDWLPELTSRLKKTLTELSRTEVDLSVAEHDKAPDSPLAIADYMAGIAAAWLDAGATIDRKTFTFRNLLEVEDSISWFCSLERGRLSSRRDRLADR